MDADAKVYPWERQPQEGEEAYHAFLTYRDLGPLRTLEAARVRLGRRSGYLKPLERWSARREWRDRVGAWDEHLLAERDQLAVAEAAKWERRRLQALEEGWQLCQALRARLNLELALPFGVPAVAPPEPPQECKRPPPKPFAAAEAEATATAVRGPSRRECLTVLRLAKLVVELEWALIAEALPPPGGIDPRTATDEEMKAFLVLNPRFGRPPPRRTGPPASR